MMKMRKTNMALAISAIALVTMLSIPAPQAQTVEAKPAGDATPMMVIDTPTFLKVAMGANQFEIDSSTLAKEKDQDDDVVALADMIIADHTKAGQELDALLVDTPNKPAGPAELSPKQQKMMSQLKAAEGDEFKTLYLDIQAQAHMEAVALFRTYAGSGDDQVIVGFARETLPALETHLGHVTADIDKHH